MPHGKNMACNGARTRVGYFRMRGHMPRPTAATATLDDCRHLRHRAPVMPELVGNIDERWPCTGCFLRMADIAAIAFEQHRWIFDWSGTPYGRWNPQYP